MNYTIITNNPMVNEKFGGRTVYDRTFSLTDVLVLARDKIHRGHRLLTHPLSGSVKPNQTPYKTVIISAEAAADTDADSLAIIEEAITMTRKLLKDAAPRAWGESTLQDFQLIDYSLIGQAID